MSLHRLLTRQLSKLGLHNTQTQDPKWNLLLERISKTYEEHDRDRELLERSLAISSAELRQLLQRLQHEASHDALTDLVNRPYLIERLRQLIAQRLRHPERNFTVLFIDLDRFKAINDSLGHAIGDALLVELSRRMLESVRASDTVARLGGDEFTILLEEISEPADINTVVERLHNALTQPIWLEGHEIHISASIGITNSQNHYLDASDMIRDADIAMYQAKSNGKSQHVFFDPSMRSKVIAQMELETDLHHAIEQGQLYVCYQPIVSFRTQSIAAFEAQVRWQHPKHGLIAPLDLISSAEGAGLVTTIDLWVMMTAAQQIKQWHAMFPEIGSWGLNVSLRSQDFDADFSHLVDQCLKACQFEPKRLRLGITQSFFAKNTHHAIQTCHQLRSMGIALILDAFGTSYSSLSQLRELPIDALKIDQSFIRKLHTFEGRKLVKTLTSLAQTLNLDVIAEGIETQEQFEHLQTSGSGYAQGHFIAKPMIARETTVLLDQLLLGNTPGIGAANPT